MLTRHLASYGHSFHHQWSQKRREAVPAHLHFGGNARWIAFPHPKTSTHVQVPLKHSNNSFRNLIIVRKTPIPRLLLGNAVELNLVFFAFKQPCHGKGLFKVIDSNHIFTESTHLQCCQQNASLKRGVQLHLSYSID